jgi:hypothetical protein
MIGTLDVGGRTRSSQRRVPAGGYQTPAMRKQAKQVIDQMGGPLAQRASAVQAQQRTPSRPAQPTYQQSRSSSRFAPDTDEDLEIAAGARQRQQYYQQPERRGMHPFFWFGMGMLALFLCWIGSVALWTAWTVNVADRWAYGPSHTTSISGVFGHKDSTTQPTYIKAFMLGSTVIVEEFPAGDVSRAKEYIGPNLAEQPGWQGSPNAAVIELTPKHLDGDRMTDLVVTVWGSVFDLTFQRENLKFALVNTGNGFKPQPLKPEPLLAGKEHQ